MKKVIISLVKWFGVSVVMSFAMLLIVPMFGVSDAITSRIADAIIAWLPIAGVLLDIIERRVRRAKSEEECDATELTTR